MVTNIYTYLTMHEIMVWIYCMGFFVQIGASVQILNHEDMGYP